MRKRREEEIRLGKGKGSRKGGESRRNILEGGLPHLACFSRSLG